MPPCWLNTLAHVITLDGAWTCTLDGQTGAIQTPGVWEAQGWPRRREGPAIYEKQVEIPAAWAGMTVQLQFDAVAYHAEVTVNGVQVGAHTGMWTPFAFEVSQHLRPGAVNDICVRVTSVGERFPMRESLAGFLPDVAIPFGGIWQSARLVAFPGAAISDVSLLADLTTGGVHLHARCHQAGGLLAVIQVRQPDGRTVISERRLIESDQLDTVLQVERLIAWEPGSPHLYTLDLRLLRSNGEEAVHIERRFGFRQLTHDGDHLLLNGRAVCLRGLLNWGWYPDKLCPAPDDDTIRDEFRRVRSFGYNLIKLCLYVPAPRYFEIADEEGMLLWLELPMWLPQVSERLRLQAPREYADILAQVHAHPSIVLYSLGCELGDEADAELLRQLNDTVRGRTSGILACDNSGSGEAYGGLGFDYADFNDYHFYCDLHYFAPLLDHFRRDWRPARPWIFGEFNDADDYRDLDEIAAAAGGALPWYYTEQNPIHPLTKLAYPEQRERMARLDLDFDAQTLQRLSREQSFVVRKHILEKVRARGGMGGYVVTGLRDTPLATSSMFDDLGRAKYPAEAFRQFNADGVLLLDQGRARLWRHGGDRPAPSDRHNHTAGAAVDLRLLINSTDGTAAGSAYTWHLIDAGGRTVEAGGGTCAEQIPPGQPRALGSIQFRAPDVHDPADYALEVECGTLRNRWPLWVYPAVSAWPPDLNVYDPAGSLDWIDDSALNDARRAALPSGGLVLAGVWTDALAAFVRAGGRALILQTGPGALPSAPCPFWRESIKLLRDHPAWRGFPQRAYTDMQFYHLAGDRAFTLDEWALDDMQAVTPIIERLDARLFTRSAYLVELRLGKGAALASTLRFGGGAGDQVVGLRANTAGRWLLARLLRYLAAGA